MYLRQVAEAAVPMVAVRGGVPKGEGETVLVVENQEAVLQVMSAMLERLDYRVLTASEGTRALTVFNAHADEVALVLTDRVMPEMGGVELATVLKQQNPDLPIVMITGYESRRDQQAGLPVDIEEYLTKPVELTKMAQTVKRVLQKEQ